MENIRPESDRAHEPSPRMTRLWERQIQLIGEALEEALRDPTIRAYWGRTAELFGGSRGVRVGFSDSRTEWLVMLIRGVTLDIVNALEVLTNLCRERAGRREPAQHGTGGPR